MIAVQIVGGVLMVLGVFLLLAHVVGGESHLQLPGLVLQAPTSVLILLAGLLVFLFPYSPWWPTDASPIADASFVATTSTSAPTPSALPSAAMTVEATSSPSTSTPMATPTPSVAGDMASTWVNVDPETRSIVRIEITRSGDVLTVHPWGACTPSPCDWGSQQVTAPVGVSTLSVDWTNSFSTRRQTYELLADGSLHVTTATHFTDLSGRQDYTSEDTFAPG